MEEPHDIELIDYLKVIWKWKWLIIIFTLCSGIIAGLISFSMPDIYEVSMMIEPGVIGLDKDFKIIEIDSATNMKFKINSQAYTSSVLKRLDNDPRKMSLRFKATQLTGSNAIKISLETKDVNHGIQGLSALFGEMTGEYQNFVDLRKTELDQKINLNKRRLELQLFERENLEKEMASMNADTNRMSGELNNMVVKEGSNADKLSLLIYTNIIQQKLSHYNVLNQHLINLKTLFESIRSEIELLETKKRDIENIKLIQSPVGSIYPIKPKRKVSVATALIAGFLFSIFLTFFIEYIQKMRSHPGSSLTSE